MVLKSSSLVIKVSAKLSLCRKPKRKIVYFKEKVLFKLSIPVLDNMNSSYVSNFLPKFNLTSNDTISNIEEVIRASRQYVRVLSRQASFTLFDHQILQNGHNGEIFSGAWTITIALTIIIIGSYATIEKPSNALEPNPAHPLFDQSDKDRTSSQLESINTQTALFMPFGSCMGLLSLYFFISRIDVATLSNIISGLTLIVSIASFSFSFKFLYKVACRKVAFWTGVSSLTFNPRYCLSLSKDTEIHPEGIEAELILPESTERERIIKEDALLRVRDPILPKDQIQNKYFTSGDLYCKFASILLAISLGLLDYNKVWFLTNIAASFIAIHTIGWMRIPSFQIATLLLVMFCIYDIYFVFGTDVMESVAINIEIPTKIVLPRFASAETDTVESSILGLGDIGLPGCAIALCLRYDLYNFHAAHPLTEFHHLQKYQKPYFFASLIGYTIALIMAITASQVYQTGQPALLYISPAVLISIGVTALIKHQTSDVWKYDENSETTNNEKKPVDIDVLCSKETLQLVGELESDEDSDEDPDYIPESVESAESAVDDDDYSGDDED